MEATNRRGRPPKRRRHSLAPHRVAVGSYIDSVVLIQHRSIHPELFERLQMSFGPGRGIWKKDIVRDERRSPTGYVVNLLSLHRPPETTIRLLKELLQHGQTIAAVHIALDVLVDTRELAIAWQDFFEHHLIINPKAPTQVSVRETTTYYNEHLAAGERFAVYSDEPARLREGLMCCHLEARVLGPRALRNARVATPDTLLQANHFKFWSKRLDLRSPPGFERLARARNKASSSRQSTALGDEANQRRVQSLLKVSQNERGVVVAQTLLANMRDAGSLYSTQPIRLFHKQRHDWLLPGRWNVQWEPDTWRYA